jgi:hypothetical protein
MMDDVFREMFESLKHTADRTLPYFGRVVYVAEPGIRSRSSSHPGARPTSSLPSTHAAMAAGIEHARGRILLTMDGDLQNDPADIPLFLEKIEEGFDLVLNPDYGRDIPDDVMELFEQRRQEILDGEFEVPFIPVEQ